MKPVDIVTAGVADTSGKVTASVVDTSGKLTAGVADTRCKLTAGNDDSSGNLPQLPVWDNRGLGYDES